MSDSPTDDRNARAATLVPYADVPALRQNDGVMIGGMLPLWPVLGAQTLGVVAQQTGPWDFSGASVAPSALFDVTAPAGLATGTTADQPMAGGETAAPAGSVGTSSPAAAILGGPSDSTGLLAATLNGGTTVPAGPAAATSNGGVTVSAGMSAPAQNAASDALSAANAFGELFGVSSAMIMPSDGIAVTTLAAATFDLAAFAGDLENQLGQLEQVLQGEVFTQALPLLGTALSDAFTQGVSGIAQEFRRCSRR